MCKQFPPRSICCTIESYPKRRRRSVLFTQAPPPMERKETGKFGARVSISLKTSTARGFSSSCTTFMQCYCLLALMKAPASLNTDSTTALLTTQNVR